MIFFREKGLGAWIKLYVVTRVEFKVGLDVDQPTSFYSYLRWFLMILNLQIMNSVDKVHINDIEIEKETFIVKSDQPMPVISMSLSLQIIIPS